MEGQRKTRREGGKQEGMERRKGEHVYIMAFIPGR